MKKQLIFILLFFCNILIAENNQSLSETDFPLGVVSKIKIDLESSDIQGLEMLTNVIREIEADSNLHLAMLEIRASLAPEKGKTLSEQLCLERIKEIESYIKGSVDVGDSLMTTSSGIAWAELRKLVSASQMQYRDEVLNIIDNVWEETRIENRLIDSRNKQLMDLAGGQPYVYMREHFFPMLINSSVTISYYRKEDAAGATSKLDYNLSQLSPMTQYLSRFTLKTNLLKIATLIPNTEFGFRIDLDSNTLWLERSIDILQELKENPNFELLELEIIASLSPEKGKTQSEQLCIERVVGVDQYIKSRVVIPDSLINIRAVGIAWEELRKLVFACQMQYRDEIINIIDSIPEETRIENRLIDSRNKQLMDLAGGHPYIYMREHFFPKLIKTRIVISYYINKRPIIVTMIKKARLPMQIVDSVAPKPPVSPTPIVSPAPVVDQVVTPPVVVKKRFIDGLALKTNLLYFAVLAPNIGVEYHFTSKKSKNWSLGLSFIAPFWRNKSKHKYYRVPFLEIDSKYYLGKKQRHSIGLYSHGGKFELKSGKVGNVGGFGGIGFAYGYLLPIAESFSLNFEIGIGYIYAKYKQYAFSQAEQEYYYLDNSRQVRKKHLFIPTKTGVTLVWKMDKIHTKGRRK